MKISVIIPLYNRAKFVERALDCVLTQTYKNIEVILVNDGSTDNTSALVEQLITQYPFKIIYLSQSNSGAAAARQTGVNEASGDVLAFLDSDDLWLPTYLATMSSSLIEAQIAWVYCPVSRHKLGSDKIISENSFYPNGAERAFLGLSTTKAANVHIIQDSQATIMQINSGLFLGFQNTVFKKEVFEKINIPNIRIGEDRLMTIMLLKSGLVGGYIKDVLVQCFEHDSNTSSVGEKSLDDSALIYLQLIAGFEAYSKYVGLTPAEKRSLQEKIADEYFWSIGYHLYLNNNDKKRALKYMFQAIKMSPLDLKKWFNFSKTIIS
jgi:glycosyltransferase involved in cell wall biosynthesis